MGFYAPAQLIKDAQRHGVKVLPIDVNVSSYDCSLEFDQGYQKLDSPCQQAVEPKLRIGFCLVKGMSEFGAKAITEARQSVIFKTIHDLVFRSGINKKDLESLAAADALKGLSGDRHRAFWQASGLDSEHRGLRKRFQEKKALDNLLTKDKINQEMSGGSLSFFTDPEFADGDFGVDVLLPVASEGQNIVGDYTSTGFTLRRHPLSLFREHLNTYRVSTANDLSSIDNEGNAKVTGLVTCRQRPMTAAGVTFLTLEDESGSVNVVIWPSLGERLRPIVRQAMLIGVVGHVQKSDGVIHLIARQLVDLSHWLGTMELSSRDFT